MDNTDKTHAKRHKQPLPTPPSAPGMPLYPASQPFSYLSVSFSSSFIIFVEIELCERKTWCYFRNLLYLCHDDYFSFPPKLGLQSSLGDFLLSYVMILKFYNTGNQNVRFVLTNLRQSLVIRICADNFQRLVMHTNHKISTLHVGNSRHIGDNIILLVPTERIL